MTNVSNGERWRTRTSGRAVRAGAPVRRRTLPDRSPRHRLRAGCSATSSSPWASGCGWISPSAPASPARADHRPRRRPAHQCRPHRTGPHHRRVHPRATSDQRPRSVERGPALAAGDGGRLDRGPERPAYHGPGRRRAGGDLLGGLKTPGQGLGLRTLAVEAVKEVQVLAAPFDVRFGTFAAGLVNAVTKSGSNRFEGSVSGYYTGRGLQGKDETGSRGEDFGPRLSMALGGPDRARPGGVLRPSRPAARQAPTGETHHRHRHDRRRRLGRRGVSAGQRHSAARGHAGRLRRGGGHHGPQSGRRAGRQLLRQGDAAAGREQPAGSLPRVQPQYAGPAGHQLPRAVRGILPRLDRVPVPRGPTSAGWRG